MYENYVDFLKSELVLGNNFLEEKLKLLIYKEDSKLFELLDFDNETIWQEPLLYAYYNNLNSNTKNALRQILYGYIEVEKRPADLKLNSDRYGNIYLPNLGWLKNLVKSVHFDINYDKNLFYLDGKLLKMDELERINSSIEVLTNPLEILDCRYYNYEYETQMVQIEKLSPDRQNIISSIIDFVNNDAIGKLLIKCCKKLVLFNDNTSEYSKFCTVNSFATLNAQGIAFLNIYQPWYNEVYYLDELAFQSSRLFFNVLTANSTEYYKVDPRTIVQSNSDYGKKIDAIEPRTYEMIFQAMFSYCNSLKLMDKYYEFTSNIQQKQELLGRMAYYIVKLIREIELFEPYNMNKINSTIYNPKGLFILYEIKRSWLEIQNKYQDKIINFDFSNQSYKFNFKLFLQKNEF